MSLDSLERSALTSRQVRHASVEMGGTPMANSLRIIDADAHVIETERTWDYLDASEHKNRPRLFSTPDNATRQYWVIDDKIAGFRFPTLSERELHEFAQRSGRNF